MKYANEYWEPLSDVLGERKDTDEEWTEEGNTGGSNRILPNMNAVYIFIRTL